jgi:hypothetical protein
MNSIARMTQGTAGVFRWVWAIPIRFKLATREIQATQEPMRGTSVRERQGDLIQFYAHYEDLVGALCDAAQYGAVEHLERRYLQQRTWMLANYPRVRKYAVAYLQFDSSDAENSSTLDGSYGDAFEALFAAPSIDSFLKADDGNMISRIMRTREALNLYGEHLRQLLAREKACA